MVGCSNRYSVQFSRSVLSNSLQPHELQHARPLRPSPTPRVYSNSCPSCQWCHPTISPLLSPSPPAFNLSQHQGLFHWAVSFIRWPKYWSFSFSISPSSEYSGLIPFRIDWLDLLAVQGTLKSLFQQHSSKAAILQCSAFFIVQLSCPSIHDSGKTIALTRQTFVSKVTSLLFSILSRSVIAFLPKSKQLLIFMAKVNLYSDFGAQKIKSVTVSIVSPSICHEVMGPDAWS